ncbi:MAG: hypothetical protein A2Z16_06600 [Chloroflexi bacterium RBG_16_54_18]|nr:MAG: hypothetical protein A2Z16_06600 [Chloroflexi bacterium RBG_16_54_18]
MLTRRIKTMLMSAAILILALSLAAAVPGLSTGRRLTADLTGAAEVPGPGDTDGSGSAVIRLNPGREVVCWTITVTGITLPATAAHIHDGDAGVAGPVFVTLSAPDANGEARGCTFVERAEILEIIRNPDEYYVNVHNSDFPAGALRGQLTK